MSTVVRRDQASSLLAEARRDRMASRGGGKRTPVDDPATGRAESQRIEGGNRPLTLAAFFAAYVLAGKAGLCLAFVHVSASAVWPPTGIALAALLTLGYRAWPAILAAAFLVNVTTAGSVAPSVGIAVGNTLEGLLGAYLVNRFARGARAFDRAQDVFKFAGLAAGLSTIVSATIGVSSLALGGHAKWADFGPIWLTWWLGDMAGALIVAPLIILWNRHSGFDVARRRPCEAASLILSTILVGLAVFGSAHARLGLRTFPLTFLVAPPLIWAAFRFSRRETATLLAVLSGISIWQTLHGSGPFAIGPANESLLLLQIFLGTVSVMALSAAALVAERRRVEEDREELLAREQAARAEAEDANRAKDEFFVMLGHELRNPLAVIISAVSILDRLESREDLAVRARCAIRHQITHLSRLVDDLVDVARVTSGKIVLACQPLNLATNVQRCVRAFADTGRLQRHVVDVQADPVWVEADPTRLDQIVSNLLANATKYTPPGGVIRVCVRSEGNEAVVRVEDSGIGIPARLLPRIFDPFVQGERGDRCQDGLGVGLTLVRRLVALHGGRVEASSDGPGCGSEFIIRLPRAAPALESRESVAAGGRLAVERRRILIVEDNADVCQMLRIALELAGHEVDAADDGHKALALATSRPPEVVFIDIGLPGMDGYEVARRLRATSKGPKPLLVALTGFGSAPDGQSHPTSDFDAYIVKPVNPEDLLRFTIGKAKVDAPEAAARF
jgi:signal transduction histidine kinase/ActR/RegA family two-component response regulator